MPKRHRQNCLQNASVTTAAVEHAADKNEVVTTEAGLEVIPSQKVADEEASMSANRAAGGSWRIHGLVLVCLAGLCASLYAWTADFPLVFDDYTYMVDNPLFKLSGEFQHLKDFDEFVTRPGRLGSDPDFAVNYVMRPVAYGSFYLQYLLDGFQPRWFRAVNIVVHTANSMLIYGLLTVLLRRSARAGKVTHSSVWFIAATSALIFAAHPLAIESVTYIIQRFTSLMVLFSLLALFLYFWAFSVASRAGRWTLRGAAVVVMLLAMQTKEPAVMVPILAVLLHWVVWGGRLRHALVKAWPLLLCVPLIPGLVLMCTAALHGGLDLNDSLNIVNSRDEPLGHYEYIITQFTVVVNYLRLMIWPSGLNLDPEWPMHESLWSGQVLGSLAVLLSLLGVTGWMYWRFRGDVRFALGFVFTLWFFITVSVSSGLVPLPDMMAEHRSYLPSIGIFVLVAVLLDRLRTSHISPGRPRAWVPAVVGVSVGALSWATCLRNEAWRTNESLWKDSVAKSPGKFRTWGNLGTAYSNKGNDERAVECYEKALELEPRFQNGLFNLSNSLLRLNRPKEALETTMELIRIDDTATRRPPIAFTLGMGLVGVGEYDEAAAIFRRILEEVPNDPKCLMALGVVYHKSRLPSRALDYYRRAERGLPGDAQLRALIAAAEDEARAKYGLR